MKIQLLDALKVSVLAVVLSFGLSYALAWTAPTATPPTGNVSAPINTGASLQTKTGNLSVANLGTNSITVTGNATVNDVYITSIGKYASELYPVNLVNGQHTVAQCSSLGGTIVDDGTGKKMCKLAGSSCPVAWAQYNNWSTTLGQSLTYSNETVIGICAEGPTWTSQSCSLSSATCSSASHLFGNIATESSVTCAGLQTIPQTSNKFGSTADSRMCKNGLSCTGATTVTSITTISEIGCY